MKESAAGQTAALEALARTHLQRKEKLIWAGQPDAAAQAAKARRGLAYWLLVSAGALAMAAWAWWPPSATDVASADPGFERAAFILLGPLLLLALVVFPLLAPYRARRRAQRTVYVLSNRRVLELLGTKAIREKERQYFKAAETTSLKPDGSGDVVIQGQGGQYSALVFEAVPDAAHVARQVEATLGANARSV